VVCSSVLVAWRWNCPRSSFHGPWWSCASSRVPHLAPEPVDERQPVPPQEHIGAKGQRQQGQRLLQVGDGLGGGALERLAQGGKGRLRDLEHGDQRQVAQQDYYRCAIARWPLPESPSTQKVHDK
jgi:hypothetical protein